MSNKNTNQKQLFIETPVGRLHVYPSTDPEYPGVYIDLKRDGHNVEAPLLSLDFSHTERPECDDPETAKKGVLCCRTWDNVAREDYISKVVFSDIDNFFAQSALEEILSAEIDRAQNFWFNGNCGKYSVSNIGYKDIHGHDQETQLYAGKLDTREGKQELIDLFESLCPEFETTCDLVTYVQILATADTMEELEEMGY